MGWKLESLGLSKEGPLLCQGEKGRLLRSGFLEAPSGLDLCSWCTCNPGFAASAHISLPTLSLLTVKQRWRQLDLWPPSTRRFSLGAWYPGFKRSCSQVGLVSFGGRGVCCWGEACPVPLWGHLPGAGAVPYGVGWWLLFLGDSLCRHREGHAWCWQPACAARITRVGRSCPANRTGRVPWASSAVLLHPIHPGRVWTLNVLG